MGFLSALAKPFKAIYNQAKLLKDIVAVLFYLALLIGVIIGAISISLPDVVTIPVASVLSFLIAFISHKSFRRLGSHFIDHNDATALALKLQEAENQLEREKEKHQRALDTLVQENRDLRNQMDTSEQTRNAYGKLQFNTTIPIATIRHDEYFIKDENLKALLPCPEYETTIPRQSWIQRNIVNAKHSLHVLLVKKIHHSDQLGFNLADIEYAIGTDGCIYLKGVNCRVLEHIQPSINPDDPSVDICWIINKPSQNSSANFQVDRSPIFDNFKASYKTHQIWQYTSELSKQNEHQAALITTRLHTMLMEKYPNLKFVSTREEAPAGLIWSSLSSNTGSIPVMEVVIQMLSGMNTMKQITD